MTLRLEGVTKRVGGQTHIHRTGLDLGRGLTVLLGPTLSGKTSLMRLMAGLDRPSEGRVLADGKDVTGVAVRQRSVAMVYQQFINYPSFTVFENIASPLRLQGRSRTEIDARVRDAARRLRIGQLLDRLPAQLSGGQQQRTAIGRALVKEAALLLLDEPLVNLDYKLREELRLELKAIFAERPATIVYATTEPIEALLLGGQVVVMGEGRVLQAGPTLEVYHRPASTAVARVFSDPPMNMLDGELSGGEIRLGEDLRFAPSRHLADLRPGRYRFGVRANRLDVARPRAGAVELKARVALAEVSGSETFIHAQHGSGDLVVQEEGIHTLDLGSPISVWLDPAEIYAFETGGALAAAPAKGPHG